MQEHGLCITLYLPSALSLALPPPPLSKVATGGNDGHVSFRSLTSLAPLANVAVTPQSVFAIRSLGASEEMVSCCAF